MTTRPKFSPELMEKILGCSAYDLREFPPRFASAKEMLEDRMVSVLSACAVRALRDPEDARPQKEVVLLHRGQLDKGFQEVFLRGFGLPKVDARLYYLLTDCFYAWLKIPVAYPWGDLWVSAEGASLLQPVTACVVNYVASRASPIRSRPYAARKKSCIRLRPPS